MSNLSVDLKEIWNQLFDAVICEKKEWDVIHQRNILSSQDILVSEKIIGSIVEKTHTKTIEENIALFDRFLGSLKKLNPNIAITTVLLPRFYKMEIISKPFMEKWKEHFYEIIESMKEKYGIKFVDLKSCQKISENPCFYFDPCHLNFVGSMAFTPLMNDYLEHPDK